jgi:predicted lipoprotein with Yx(FWY)xxD motif
MSLFRTDNFFHARFSALSIGLIGVALVGGCVEDAPGLAPVSTAGSAGSSSESGAGADTSAGGHAGTSPATAGSGDSASQGGSSAGDTALVPAAGTSGDSEPEASAGAGGQDGGTSEDGVHLAPACPFHSDAASVEGAAGAGGAGGEAPTITVQLSPFVGGYLADATGRALYTYGGDLPGDCNTEPQSLCTADCPVSWPPFDAGARVLAPEISDAGFGTIQRADGSHQTTYMGWPLYYYKSDLTAGSVTGQGKGKVWHVAELSPPSVTIMKAGAIKYLADTAGRTLYVSAADQSGTADTDPVSNCSGACLSTFEGFHDNHLSVVSSLEPPDFSVFLRHGAGGLQLAYKGMPLYRAATDLKSGDMNGTAVAGFTAAVP